MIERQILACATVLAAEPVAQKHIKPRESWLTRRFDICFQRDDRGQLHLERRASDSPVVIGNDVHPVHKDRLDGVLPGP